MSKPTLCQMTPGEKLHYENKARLDLAEANTRDVLERYDNESYHRLTWLHEIQCTKCVESGMNLTTVTGSIPPTGDALKCGECGSTEVDAAVYLEIVEITQ